VARPGPVWRGRGRGAGVTAACARAWRRRGAGVAQAWRRRDRDATRIWKMSRMIPEYKPRVFISLFFCSTPYFYKEVLENLYPEFH